MRNNQWKQHAAEKIRQQQNRHKWRKRVAVLTMLAVFLTVFVTLPSGITLETEALACQASPHTHTADCYGADGSLVCGSADFFVHTHTADCYDENGELLCPLAEIEPHTHTSACYTEERICTCGLEETPGHTHTSACYTVPQGAQPACGLDEADGHVHTPACYPDAVLTCGLEESEGHVHTDACYETVSTLTCEKPEIILHTHTADCYDAAGHLTCGMLEVKEHVHDDSCFVTVPETAVSSEESAPVSSAPAAPESVGSEPAESEPADSSETSSQPAPVPAGDGLSWATAEKVENAAPQIQLFAENAASADLEEYVTSFTVETMEGSTWKPVGGTVTNGDPLRVTIRYAMGQDVVTERNKTFTYQLPNGIGLSERETGNVVDEKNGQVVGTYTIETNGQITITFYDPFATGEAISGMLQFQGAVTATGEEGNDKIDLGADGTVITVKPKPTNTDLSIGKVDFYVKSEADAEKYNGLDITVNQGDLIYNVSIMTTAGSDGPITVTDTFQKPSAGSGTEASVAYDQNNLVIYKRPGNEKIPLENGIQITYDTADNGQPTFTITGLPKLGQNEAYDIYYTATPTLPTNGSGYLQMSNEATATDNKNSAAATARVTLREALVQKSAVYNDGTGNVKWTVTLNADQQDISNMTFTDTMTYNGTGTYDLSKIENFSVIAYNGNNWIANVTDYFLNDGGTYPVENNRLTVHFSDVLKKLNEQSPAADIEAYKAYKYVITYETPFPEGIAAGQSVAFHNTAWLNGFSATADFTHAVTTPLPSVTKRSTETNFNTGTGIGTIKWTTTMTYDSSKLEETIENWGYSDWISNANYKDNGTVIADSHYTTLRCLLDTLKVQNPDGVQLNREQDYTLKVSFAKDMPAYPGFDENLKPYNGELDLNSIFNAVKHDANEIDQKEYDQPVALFEIQFTKEAINKLQGYQQVLIEYQTYVDQTKDTTGNVVRIPNVASGKTTENYYNTNSAYVYTSFYEKLQKQASPTGLPEGAITEDSFNSYTDDLVKVERGDSGGVLHYRIRLYDYTEGETVTDTLPEGATFLEDSVRLFTHSTTDDTVTERDASYYLRSSSYDNNTNIVHFVLSNLADFRDAVLDLCYDVSIADDPAWNAEEEPDSLTYQNTVKWDGETDSTETKVTNHKATLEKTGKLLENTDTLHYEIVVNPEVRDLVPNADTITLSDQITTPNGTSVALKAETVKVYEYNAEAPDSHGAPLPDDAWKFSYDAPTMTFTLPDQTACVVVYEYTINRGQTAVDFTVNNTASLMGQAAISSGDDIEVEVQDSSASANKAKLTIYKVDKENNASRLSDAAFTLERYEPDDKGNYSWQISALTAHGEGGTFVVGEDGYIELQYVQHINDSTLYNTLYKLTEVEPPEGYMLDSTPHYFVWMEQGATEDETYQQLEMPDDEKVSQADITFIAYSTNVSIFVENAKQYTLPETGGPGWPAGVGAALFGAACAGGVVWYRKKRTHGNPSGHSR